MRITIENIMNEINETMSSELTWESARKLDLLLCLKERLEKHFTYECAEIFSSEIKPFDMITAKRWIDGMENADGTRGGHWSYEQIKAVIAQRGLAVEPIRLWAAMNAEYSDRVMCNRKHGIADDNISYYIDAAMAFWIDDEDAVEDKEKMYYECIVKH